MERRYIDSAVIARILSSYCFYQRADLQGNGIIVLARLPVDVAVIRLRAHQQHSCASLPLFVSILVSLWFKIWGNTPYFFAAHIEFVQLYPKIKYVGCGECSPSYNKESGRGTVFAFRYIRLQQPLCNRNCPF